MLLLIIDCYLKLFWTLWALKMPSYRGICQYEMIQWANLRFACTAIAKCLRSWSFDILQHCLFAAILFSSLIPRFAFYDIML
jgi:hypothetical protein